MVKVGASHAVVKRHRRTEMKRKRRGAEGKKKIKTENVNQYSPMESLMEVRFYTHAYSSLSLRFDASMLLKVGLVCCESWSVLTQCQLCCMVTESVSILPLCLHRENES